MTVGINGSGQIHLSGEVSLDESEQLLSALIDRPGVPVDWRDCRFCHTAVLQVLMAAQRQMVGPPAGDFLVRWIALN